MTSAGAVRGNCTLKLGSNQISIHWLFFLFSETGQKMFGLFRLVWFWILNIGNSEMCICFLEKICWCFSSKLPGEELAVHSSARWEAGQFAHHWQLVGWQGTRHTGCQQLVPITSLTEWTHSHQKAGSSVVSRILWRKSAVLETFSLLQVITYVTVWSGKLFLLCYTRPESWTHRHVKKIKITVFKWNNINAESTISNLVGGKNVHAWQKFWAVTMAVFSSTFILKTCSQKQNCQDLSDNVLRWTAPQMTHRVFKDVSPSRKILPSDAE